LWHNTGSMNGWNGQGRGIVLGGLLGVLVFLGSQSVGDVNVGSIFWWEEPAAVLKVAFLDVGQGDAIFIETPDGIQLLIDGGPDASVLRALPEVMPWWDRSLAMIVATHPDKDHIGGLVDVLVRYEVDQIVRTDNENETAVAAAFTLAAAQENSTLHIAQAGDVIKLGATTTLRIFSPAGVAADWDSNQASIVAQLQYGEIEFMFTGDIFVGLEEYLARTYGAALESEVLKVAHHGSRTSTAESFLQAVTPRYAVVSAGLDNRYGHPHREVVERLERHGSQIVNTAELGTIVFKSDGKRVWRE